MKFDRNDIEKFISMFRKYSEPTDRYSSFDFCYHHFANTDSKDILRDIEKSCLLIGFYLASWGMYRGSSFLLTKSAKYYEGLVKYIAKLNPSIWEIDVDAYDDRNIEIICSLYNDIKKIVVVKNNTHLTLVTKIMLGVFGNIPAYDSFFCDTFRRISKNKCGFRVVNPKSLSYIKLFYDENKSMIDKLSSKIYVKDFKTGKSTEFYYTKAKIIDMYGFMKGYTRGA